MKNIPVLHVEGQNLAEAYEKALVNLYENGTRFKTQYDKPGDPLSIDATMNITVLNPMSDPMIHKAFPGGIEDLREYVYELEGLKDDWVKNLNDPKDTRWEYTYHGRFAHWGQWKELSPDGVADCSCQYTHQMHGGSGKIICEHMKPVSVSVGNNINQYEQVIEKLCKQPFTRQAQMITWMPNLDMTIFDPPCLQSWWGRILEDEDGTWWLNYNMRIRSNDAWGAYFMNTFGLTMMTKNLIADEIAKRTGRTVKLGRMNWQADSWHIYGKDIRQAKERLFDRIATTSFEDRVYSFSDETVQDIWNESEKSILDKIAIQSEKMKKG
jgi:thymidylate synthase